MLNFSLAPVTGPRVFIYENGARTRGAAELRISYYVTPHGGTAADPLGGTVEVAGPQTSTTKNAE